MYKHAVMTLGFFFCFSAIAFGQQADGPFQVRFATSLKKRDNINMTNTGANNTAICANVYGFSTTGQMLDCCSCVVQPNALVSISITRDLLEGLRPSPKAMVLKVLASTLVVGSCNGSSVSTLVTGMGAWKGDEPFMPSTLSAGELNRLTTQCGFLHSAANICPVCRS